MDGIFSSSMMMFTVYLLPYKMVLLPEGLALGEQLKENAFLFCSTGVSDPVKALAV
jgi:hypothetical protein